MHDDDGGDGPRGPELGRILGNDRDVVRRQRRRCDVRLPLPLEGGELQCAERNGGGALRGVLSGDPGGDFVSRSDELFDAPGDARLSQPVPRRHHELEHDEQRRQQQ